MALEIAFSYFQTRIFFIQDGFAPPEEDVPPPAEDEEEEY